MLFFVECLILRNGRLVKEDIFNLKIDYSAI